MFQKKSLWVLSTLIILFGVGFILAQDAGATCICNLDPSGAPGTHDYSGITTQSGCESMCVSQGGVLKWEAPIKWNDCTCADGVPFRTTDTCDVACAAIQANNPGTTESTNSDEDTSVCGTQPPGTDCACDTEARRWFCAGDEYGPSDKVPTQEDSSGLPGVQKDSGGKPGGSTPGRVELPNFIGAKTISELILKIAKFLMALAIPFAITMLIWSGFMFATAQGNEEKIGRAKKNFTWTIIGISVILASEAVISYIQDLLGGQGTRTSALIDNIKELLYQVIALLFTLVTVYFIWGIVEYVRAAGDEKAIAQGKKHMIWGIIGMAIMAGAWPLVEILIDFFQD